MSFPLVSFKVNSFLMENSRKTQQNRMTMALPSKVNATRRDGDGGGREGGPHCFINLSSALTVHVKQVNKQRYYSFQ